MHVIVPSRYEDSIIWLQDEVVANVVNDYGLGDVTAEEAQVFHQEWAILTRVLSVQSVFDVVAHVDLIDHLVCVLLQGCSEDDDLVVLRQRFNELHAARSHQEETVILIL